MSNYYTILTNLGAALHANAQVMQTTVPWTHMCLGDGAGAPVVPVQTQTALKREVHRLPITDIAQHPDNPNWLIVEAVVPSDVGGWTVRETAIYGGANGAQCIAVGNYPETYKPVLAEGAAREMVMRMVVEISSTATVKLTIDPAVAIASRAWVESLVASPQKRGLVKLATVDESVEGVRPDVAVTPEGLGAALAALAEVDGRLAERVATLDSELDSVILYPNGTAAAPANAVAQARYVIPNPFPGFHVICLAEIKIGNNWGGTNWHFDGANNTSYGINAEVFGTAAENIVVQVGKYLLGNSINGGDPFGNVSLVTTAPWRLVVKKMKGAM